MTWDRMKKFFICIFSLLALVCVSSATFAATEQSKKPTVVVLSDSNHRHGTTYLICGAASDIFASDIINRLNQSGKVQAPLLGESMAQVTKNIPLYTNTFFREYKYNYNIDFINLKRVTRGMNADYVLMVTSGIDIQSQLFKENWWNKWGLSSSMPITPTYKLITMVSLIDKRTYSVVWQDMYQREIKAENMDLGITQFSPNYPQLAKIKKYSTTMSEYVVNHIEDVIVPHVKKNNEPKAVEMKGKFLNEGTKIYYPSVNGEVVKQNFNETKQNISDFTNEQHKKWQKFQQERQQKKNIENVNRIEKKKQTTKTKQNNEEKLFDTIRNNIEDVSNTLTEPEQGSKMTPVEEIKPAVEIKKQPESFVDENIKPIGENQQTPDIEKQVLPVRFQQPAPKTEYITPVEHIEPRQPIDYEIPKNHVPRYDWNLKNIYLQKIGLSNLY